ncbi:SF1B family DNA helicase RecD2 [Lacticaseibacillus yichunensis]|uniref:ATP-dependent RecD2 DNA helicase n=1 Tax=Lacticaseibacillus yichunensis TaxID=2486015 RepID=A0ABW4CNM2_9LACO|nr:ATP-dependent RecD-like DNA helicase [Lacticaseibacillus yichunensis]
MSDDEATLSGRVKSIYFENAANFFKIMEVAVGTASFTWAEPTIVVTGSFGDIKEDEAYTFTGKLVNHPKYGPQFAADNYHADRPTSKQGLVNYLSSDKFPGIGTKTAERIVEALGVTAIDQIMKDPAVLVPLVPKADRRKTLIDTLQANLGMEQVIIGLNDFGFTSNMAAKIYQTYDTDALEVIKENPYQLIADIDGIGFKRADAIAARLDIAPDDPTRLQGAVFDTLSSLTDGEGDTYVALKPLLDQSIGLLESARNVEIAPTAVADAVLALANANKVVADGDKVYPKRLFDAEWEIATRLRQMTEGDTKKVKAARMKKALRAAAKASGVTYDESQETAIKSAMAAPVFLLTGGPGTGKTTVINGIVHTYAALNDLSLDVNSYQDETFPIMLAAPTGRAAKRIAETTNLPAGTIHRLLGLAVDSTQYEPKDLPDGLLIIDEMSMVDTYLFRTLLAAIHPGIKLILVGDKDQLPSVGPGQVFADLLRAGVLPAMELTHIHRQDASSSIIPFAHAINEGKLPADWQRPAADRSFILCPPNQLPKAVGQVVAKAGGKFDHTGIQVLAPMYRGVAGIDELNPMIQDILNPLRDARAKEVVFGNVRYRIGDKVLQLVNDPENNVFNGEIGIIQGIMEGKYTDSKTDELTIDFDGNELQYKRNDWTKITLAYATSIHKAQGSEFDVVVLPLTLQSRRMLRRNLLYTAVTRARNFLILMGDPRAFELAVQEVADNRHTSLVARLQETMPGRVAVDKAKPAPDNKEETHDAPVAKSGVVPTTDSARPHDEARTGGADAAGPAQATEPVPVGDSEPAPVGDAAMPNDWRLTPDLVLAQSIDPMIGMQGIRPEKESES